MHDADAPAPPPVPDPPSRPPRSARPPPPAVSGQPDLYADAHAGAAHARAVPLPSLLDANTPADADSRRPERQHDAHADAGRPHADALQRKLRRCASGGLLL